MYPEERAWAVHPRRTSWPTLKRKAERPRGPLSGRTGVLSHSTPLTNTPRHRRSGLFWSVAGNQKSSVTRPMSYSSHQRYSGGMSIEISFQRSHDRETVICVQGTLIVTV